MRTTVTLLAVLAAGNLLATTALAQDKTTAQGTEPTAKAVIDALGAGENVTVVAVVQAVDYQHRLVTLKGEDGKIVTIKAGEEVRNLAQIKPGAIVKASYSQALVLEMSKVKSGGVNVREDTVAIGRAPLGQLPAGAVTQNVEMIGTIMAIDKAKRTVEVQGALHTVVLKVPADWDLKDLKVGDQVAARYVQELAIGVSAAPEASFNPPKIGQE